MNNPFDQDSLLNRASKRLFERTNPECGKCGIRWKDRHQQMSLCNIGFVFGDGHHFV